jgi:hypothetical protein
MWRCAALVPPFLVGAFMFLEALVLGSWSVQWIAAYAMAFGALAVWGFTVAAAVATHRRRPVRPWIVGCLVTIAATLVVVTVSWGPVGAIYRRHHHASPGRTVIAATSGRTPVARLVGPLTLWSER